MTCSSDMCEALLVGRRGTVMQAAFGLVAGAYTRSEFSST